MNLVFSIPGKPRSWSRIGWNRGHAWDKQKGVKEEIGTLALAAMRKQGQKRTELPVVARLQFYGPSTASDLDNLSKLILDALNGIAWEDDRQVIELHSFKILNSEIPPCTRIELYSQPKY
jgi:crossover junction endodeoxyribonuclease RusA